MNFSTDMEPKNITIIEKHDKWSDPDFDYECDNARVQWNLSIEARSWGIKGIHPYATDVTMDIEVIQYTDEDDIVVKTIEISRGEGWHIDSEFDEKDVSCIAPQDITIDFKKKLIEVQF